MKFCRSLSLLLCLSMLLTLLTGMTLTVSASSDIITTPTGYTEASDVVYKTSGGTIANWGARGEDCVFLSKYATSYYTGNYAYSVLSQKTGGTSQSNAPSSSLYSSLKSMMSSKHSHETSYNETRDLYRYTDCLRNDTAHISSFYSGTQLNGSWDSGKTWNREHTWPNSKGLGGDDENDIMMLRPTSVSENSSRGNTAYGESSGYYDPGVAVRGDCARIVLYVYTRWGNTGKMWGQSGVMENMSVLLKWMEEDPVDTWEMGRNDSVQSITGVRNVFVDYPEYAWLLFGQDIPSDMVTPSGEAMGGESYTVNAVSNNTAYGTVSLSGKTITATPKTGYQISSTNAYTVSPAGAATVTRSGNTFAVSNVTADCTITINFEAAPAATITYIVPVGVNYSGTTSSYVGYTVKLASVSNVPEGYTFYCWSDSYVEDTIASSVPGKSAGSSYTITEADTTFYAVFYDNEKQDGGWLFTSNPSSCDHENTEVRNAKDAACATTGYTGDTYCLDCGNCIATGSVISALGHDYKDGICTRCGEEEPCPHVNTEVRNAKKATCTEDGYTGDIYCKDCGQKVYPGATIKAMGHDYEDGVCTKCGQKDPAASDDPVDPDDPIDPDDPVDPDDPIDPETPKCYFDSFSDCKDVWYHEAVDYAVDNELMNGVGDGKFDPNGSMTRAMIVTVLYRAAGSPEVKEASTFTDVPMNQWYSNAIAWAQDHEIVNGVSDTEFAPEENVTREQIAAILWRYSGSPKVEADLSSFKDTGKISSYAVDGINWAVAEGILNGDNGNLKPTNNATRAEFSCIIMRYLEGSYPCAALK